VDKDCFIPMTHILTREFGLTAILREKMEYYFRLMQSGCNWKQACFLPHCSRTKAPIRSERDCHPERSEGSALVLAFDFLLVILRQQDLPTRICFSLSLHRSKRKPSEAAFRPNHKRQRKMPGAPPSPGLCCSG